MHITKKTYKGVFYRQKKEEMLCQITTKKNKLMEAIEEMTLLGTGKQYDTEHTDEEVFWIAIEALEKQVAKKPMFKIEWVFVCPTCDAVVAKHLSHCNECGQKLDWMEG